MADLSIFDNPTMPKVTEKNLTESEVYHEVDFGKYLIKIPNGYLFSSANRVFNQNNDLLLASLPKGYDGITLMVPQLDKYSQSRIVSP